jgi:hypothetical protein
VNSPGTVTGGTRSSFVHEEVNVGNGVLEPLVLLLQLFESLRVDGRHAAVLRPPTTVGRLGHSDLLADVGHAGATSQLDLGLTQLADDLLR